MKSKATTKKMGLCSILSTGRFGPMFLLSMLISAFLSITANQSSAGVYHASSEETGGVETLACSQCHTMHGTQAGTNSMYDGGGPNGYSKLLRASTTMNLCKYCHATSRDVGGGKMSPVVYNNTSYIPSAGDFKHGNVAYDPNRHDVERINMKNIMPPGYTAGQATWDSVVDRGGGSTGTFTCIFCHDQHGNKNYRNLRYDPGNIVNDIDNSDRSKYISFTTAGGVCNTSSLIGNVTTVPCDVNDTAATDLTKYYRSNVRFLVPNGDEINRLSGWCGKCHGDFYGLSGAANVGGIANASLVGSGDTNVTSGTYTSPWVRHPAGDVTIGATNLHTDLTAWTTGATVANRTRYADDDAAATFDAGDQPLCLSCHYAHGGGNKDVTEVGGDPTYAHSMLVYLDSAGTFNIVRTDTGGYTTPSTSTSTGGAMKRVCNQCHNQ